MNPAAATTAATSATAGAAGPARPADGKRLLMVGLGHLGVRVLEVLLRDPGPHHYVVAGRDPEAIRRLANLARQYSSAFGDRAAVEPVPIDVADVEATAATIERLDPDLIFAAVTLQSWWVVGTLPPALAACLEPACVGPWLPMHLTLIAELMQAVRAAGSDATVVNASYPDVTHPVLATADLAPDVGIGNIAIPLVGLRLALADEHAVELDRVQIRAVFHHYVSYQATRSGDPRPAPFHVSAWLGTADEPAAGEPLPIDPATVFAPLATTHKRSSGPHFQHVTAATAGVVLRALLDDTEVYTHAPGPAGLPGGYPVRIAGGEVSLALPDGIDLPTALQINDEGGVFDGIERIDPDGTVHFRTANAEPLRRYLGYEAAPLPLAESRPRSVELMRRFVDFAVTGAHRTTFPPDQPVHASRSLR
jgi:hypothetical protein